MHEQIKIEEEIIEHAKLTLQTESNSNNILMRFEKMFTAKAWGKNNSDEHWKAPKHQLQLNQSQTLPAS